jgi:hypothetical protein
MENRTRDLTALNIVPQLLYGVAQEDNIKCNNIKMDPNQMPCENVAVFI